MCASLLKGKHIWNEGTGLSVDAVSFGGLLDGVSYLWLCIVTVIFYVRRNAVIPHAQQNLLSQNFIKVPLFKTTQTTNLLCHCQEESKRSF